MSQSTGGFGSRLAGLVARQDRREIEAEAVDMHLGHPVAQAVLDQPAHDRLVGIERVAAAGVVGVAATGPSRACNRRSFARPR